MESIVEFFGVYAKVSDRKIDRQKRITIPKFDFYTRDFLPFDAYSFFIYPSIYNKMFVFTSIRPELNDLPTEPELRLPKNRARRSNNTIDSILLSRTFLGDRRRITLPSFLISELDNPEAILFVITDKCAYLSSRGSIKFGRIVKKTGIMSTLLGK